MSCCLIEQIQGKAVKTDFLSTTDPETSQEAIFITNCTLPMQKSTTYQQQVRRLAPV